MTRYRPDIDGLRAVAVASVVLYHAGLPGVGGGFVGVDVFFVISGYLITSNLLGDLDRDRFSILDFYERRARRILPALFAMILGAAIGAALLLPDDLKQFWESAAAATLSLSNVFFYSHTGYFTLDALNTPLLHTWSLAVEEQFYLALPLMLFVLARLGQRGRVAAWLGGLWAVSFAVSLWQVAHFAPAAFYLPFGRAWELLTGSLLASAPGIAPTRRWMREAAGATGLILILGAALLLDVHAPFPGANALWPCLGAALVIGSGGETLAGRLLTLRPMVFVGLISYSLYLWHWPLLVFAHYYGVTPLALPARVAIVAASVLMATGSWWFVERPFRRKRLLARRGPLFATAAAAGACVCALGAGVVLAKGLPQRLPQGVRQYAMGLHDYSPDRDRCFARTVADTEAGRLCRFGAPGRPTLILWGDSHADALKPGLADLADATGTAAVEAAHPSCPPLIDVKVREAQDNGCEAVNAAVLAQIERQDIRDVVLEARWGGYAEGARYFDPYPPIHLSDSAPGATESGNHAVLAAGLERTVARLTGEGRRVFLVRPSPELKRSAPDVLALAALTSRRIDIRPRRTAYLARQGFVLNLFDRLGARYGAHEIDPAPLLCGPQTCAVERAGRSLYYDDDHLSGYGARLLIPALKPVFEAPASVHAQVAGAAAGGRPHA